MTTKRHPDMMDGGPAGIRHDGGVAGRGDDVRDALVRQWEAIAAAVATVDLETPSRVAGWRNREVVAHLCLQPALLRRFTAAASTRHAVVTVAVSLAGTHSLAGVVDASAREAAEAGRIDFAEAAGEAVPPLRAADLSATVVTIQGPIRLADYLVTRCVEAVVHGCDLVRSGPGGAGHHGWGVAGGARCPGSSPPPGGPAAPAAGLDRCRDRSAAGLRAPGRSSPRNDLSGQDQLFAGDTRQAGAAAWCVRCWTLPGAAAFGLRGGARRG